MRASLFALLLLAGCQRTVPAEQAPDVRGTTGSGLERAAIESGAIVDVARISPVGLYRRRHEAGSDSLCVIPDGRGAFRFGAEAMFGANEQCRGQGTARRAGDKLILRFSGRDGCIVVAQYDGDQVALPGVVDMTCAQVCTGRGTLEGVSFPRVANEAQAALGARDRDGDALCKS